MRNARSVIRATLVADPNPDDPLGFDLPTDLRTGARVDEVWSKWLAFDPLHAVEHHVDALRSLELLHLECGTRDEYNLQFGLRVLSDRLLIRARRLAGHDGAALLSAAEDALS